MSSIKDLSKDEKLQMLHHIEEDEDRFFQDYTEELDQLVQDENAEIRGPAVQALWDYPSTHFLKILMDLAEKDPDDDVRNHAIAILGRYIYEGTVEGYSLDLNDDIIDNEDISKEDFLKTQEFLLSIYHNPGKSLDEKRFALEALSFSIEEEILDYIQSAFEHKDERMKKSALFCMARNGNPRWESILSEALMQDNDLLIDAIKAAGEYGLESAGSRLSELTYSEDPEIKKEAIWALGISGWENAFQRLDELSSDKNKEIKELAQIALEEWLSITSTDEL